jgi:hypothetical protein
MTEVSHYVVNACLQELVVPPPPCPPHVAAQLELAAQLHNEGQHGKSMATYTAAHAAWREAAVDAALGHRVGLKTDQKM